MNIFDIDAMKKIRSVLSVAKQNKLRAEWHILNVHKNFTVKNKKKDNCLLNLLFIANIEFGIKYTQNKE